MITNGSVDQTSSSMTIGDYTVSYNSTKKTYEATEKGNTPQVEVLCTAKTAATTITNTAAYIIVYEFLFVFILCHLMVIGKNDMLQRIIPCLLPNSTTYQLV